MQGFFHVVKVFSTHNIILCNEESFDFGQFQFVVAVVE